MIAGFAPGDLSETFFVSSGSEAVESAIKFARNYHLARGDEDRYKVISRNWAYHGTTLGALSVTGIPKFRDPYLPMLSDGTRHVPNTRQCTSPAGTPVAELSCVQAIEGDHPGRGPRDGFHGYRRADPERWWRPGPARRVLAGTPPHLRPLRRAAGGRRGHLLVRPVRSLVRQRAQRCGARHDYLRQRRHVGLPALGWRGHPGPAGRRGLRPRPLARMCTVPPSGAIRWPPQWLLPT
ncbi:MAG: hypothetical protein Ct9H300mP31_04190 [Acidimicrobiaceae bacterium]|nr:MAG: hypothetical protein Ct9H300mP31_04190 [Acidimicrobiaceae bacterium]